MNDERPTTEIKTVRGHTAVLREWITVQEYREIMSIYLDSTKISSVDAKKETANIDSSSPAEAGIRAQDKAIEFVVAELDGSKENILDRIKKLPLDDGREIIEAVEKVSNPKKK